MKRRPKVAQVKPDPLEVIWSAAIRAGFDRMGASLLDRARRDRRLSVSRGTKVASNLPALCEILVKLDAELLRAGFRQATWDTCDLNRQYRQGKTVVSVSLTRNGVWLYAASP